MNSLSRYQRWFDGPTCGLNSVHRDLDVEDAVAAAHSIGVGTLSARSLLSRFDLETLDDAYQALSECAECDCPEHGESRDARTELLMRMGDLT